MAYLVVSCSMSMTESSIECNSNSRFRSGIAAVLRFSMILEALNADEYGQGDDCMVLNG
ncbi:hypothetical protein CWI39_2472p0010 [Hamiltosporidium magnivora]|uniref:Uncharacterized protein n=1 Tax=Hamiltosporidium magnivora TaxID=148818 RepID=A0A4V2JU19_9MICR|nr:hypothetical protein CWI39_2472p0010 [Hamiltosporidium magnivora]